MLRRSSQRDNAFLVSLAADQHVARFQFQIRQFGVHQFCNSQRACIEQFKHCPIARRNCTSVPSRSLSLQRVRSCQCSSNFVLCQRFRQNFPLPGGFNIQGRVVLDSLVEQQITIKMAQCRELASHTAAIHLVGKKLLQEFANITSPRRQQSSLLPGEKLRKLIDVRGLRSKGEPRQTFLDSQIVEKSREHRRIGLDRHPTLVCPLSDTSESDGPDATNENRSDTKSEAVRGLDLV